MKEVLLRKLIEKQYFIIGTEVTAKVLSNGLAYAKHKFESTYTVSRIYEKNNKLFIEAYSITDGSKAKIGVEDITKIDGMVPERFGQNYMIAEDGSDLKPIGKRRGRKPKGWTPEDDDFYEFEDEEEYG